MVRGPSRARPCILVQTSLVTCLNLRTVSDGGPQLSSAPPLLPPGQVTHGDEDAGEELDAADGGDDGPCESLRFESGHEHFPQQWDRQYEALRVFCEDFSHLPRCGKNAAANIPAGEELLGRWVRSQRRRWRQGKLSTLATKQLEKLPCWCDGSPSGCWPPQLFMFWMTDADAWQSNTCALVF